MIRREKSNYAIQSVSHALDVLEQFNQNAEEIGVTELSKRLKLHKNNVFRLLATLEARGYIEQNRATENYRLGLKCFQLGQTYVNQMGFLLQAKARTRFPGSTEDIDLSDDVQRFDFGLAMGGGVELGRVIVDGRYTLGLSDTDKDTSVPGTSKNRTISFTAGFRF